MTLAKLPLAGLALGAAVALGACFGPAQNPGYEPYPSTTYGTGGISNGQVQACRDLVSNQYNVGTGNVATRGAGLDQNGDADVRWSLNNGPYGNCIVNRQDRVIQFQVAGGDTSSNGSYNGQYNGNGQYNSNGQYGNGQPNGNNGYRPMGQPTGKDASFFQVNACRREVAAQLGSSVDNVQAGSGTQYSDGGAVIDWSARSGERGMCAVDKNGQVMQIQRQ